MKKPNNLLLEFRRPLTEADRLAIHEEFEALKEIIETTNDRSYKIRKLSYVCKELIGVIFEFKALPCKSLESRMIDTAHRYLPTVKEFSE